MTTEEKQRALVAIQTMIAGFGRSPDELMVNAYWLAVRESPIEAVVWAVAKLIETESELPSPAQLRRKCGGKMPVTAPYHQKWIDPYEQPYKALPPGQPEIPNGDRPAFGDEWSRKWRKQFPNEPIPTVSEVVKSCLANAEEASKDEAYARSQLQRFGAGASGSEGERVKGAIYWQDQVYRAMSDRIHWLEMAEWYRRSR